MWTSEVAQAVLSKVSRGSIRWSCSGAHMARVVVLGAGISGHTAALHLRRLLDARHEVVVISPKADWNWIPSNIWVGVGRMTGSQVPSPLAQMLEEIQFQSAFGEM